MMAKKLLGDAVKEERLRRNLSQNALAELVHVSLRTISDIENYNGNPRFENLCLLGIFPESAHGNDHQGQIRAYGCYHEADHSRTGAVF